MLACNNKSDISALYNIESRDIDYSSEILQPSSSIIKSQKFVLLENREESHFKQIDKAIFRDDKIYILDFSSQYLVYVFDLNGKFLNKIGSKESGSPGYKMLCDFDVDLNGTVYLYDRQNKKIFIHQSTGEFIKVLNLPFRADALIKIGKGYIFSSAVNNDNVELGNTKVVVTDDSLQIVKKYFNYSREFKDHKVNTGLFVRAKEGVLYNKSVNDSLFIFNDNDGKISDSYVIDFGKSRAPSHLSDTYLYAMPLRVGDYLIGPLIKAGQKAILYYDFVNEKSYTDLIDLKNISHRNLNYPIGVLNDSIIVSYFDRNIYDLDVEKNKLDARVIGHIEQGGQVLILNQLQKSDVK